MKINSKNLERLMTSKYRQKNISSAYVLLCKDLQSLGINTSVRTLQNNVKNRNYNVILLSNICKILNIAPSELWEDK